MIQLSGPYEIAQLSFSPDGRYLTGAARMSYGPVVWDTQTGAVVRLPLLRDLFSRWGGVRFARDCNKLLYSGIHWSVQNHPLLFAWLDLDGDRTWRELDAGVVGEGSPWFEPLDGGRVLVSLGDRLEMRSVGDDGAVVREWNLAPDGHVRAVTPDGHWLAVGDHQFIRLFDLAAGLELPMMRIPNLRSYIPSLAFSPDGSILAAAIAHHVHLFAIPSGKWLAKLHGPTRHQVAAIAYSPDGESLATAEGTGLARVWDVVGRRERTRYQWPIAMGRCIAYALDGLRLAVGGSSGAIVVCDTE